MDSSINQNSPFIVGYIKSIELEYNIHIPTGINIIIQRFIGLFFQKTKMDTPTLIRVGSKGWITIHTQNVPQLFIQDVPHLCDPHGLFRDMRKQ